MSVSYSSINRKLSISEMAEIHGITRQTLIYYDKIDLFKPAITEENGYRYYSTLQIPLLREICFLRSIGMPLDDIRKNNTEKNSNTMIELLDNQNEKLKEQISKLTRQQQMLESRLHIYNEAHDFSDTEYNPAIIHFPERTILYHPWEGEHSRYSLHYALMKVWNECERFGLLPPNRYGSFFFYDDLMAGTPLAHTGSCVVLTDLEPDMKPSGLHTLIEADYVCMQRFGMPYDEEAIDRLCRWIDENGYEIIGDYYDECLLDASFYAEADTEPDFCELQIPIRKRP